MDPVDILPDFQDFFETLFDEDFFVPRYVELETYNFKFIREGDTIQVVIAPLHGKFFHLSLHELLLLFRYLTSAECHNDRLPKDVVKCNPEQFELWTKQDHTHVHDINTTLQVH